MYICIYIYTYICMHKLYISCCILWIKSHCCPIRCPFVWQKCWHRLLTQVCTCCKNVAPVGSAGEQQGRVQADYTFDLIEVQRTAGRRIFILDIIRWPSVRRSESVRLLWEFKVWERWEEHPLWKRAFSAEPAASISTWPAKSTRIIVRVRVRVPASMICATGC